MFHRIYVYINIHCQLTAINVNSERIRGNHNIKGLLHVCSKSTELLGSSC